MGEGLRWRVAIVSGSSSSLRAKESAMERQQPLCILKRGVSVMFVDLNKGAAEEAQGIIDEGRKIFCI
jgi:hypothetical protein